MKEQEYLEIVSEVKNSTLPLQIQEKLIAICEKQVSISDLEILKAYCEARIEMMDAIMSKKKFFFKHKMRFMMGKIAGMENVLAKINKMLDSEL